MIKINTTGGNVYFFKGSYQEIQRALRDIGCNYLFGHTRKDNRVIIPVKAVDSVEEVDIQ